MAKFSTSFCTALVLALAISFSSPAWSQEPTDQNSDIPPVAAPVETATPPESHTPPPAVAEHAKTKKKPAASKKHHKKKKAKKAHKKAHAKKAVKKSKSTVHHKKAKATPKHHTKEVKHEAPAKPAKKAAAVEKTTIVPLNEKTTKPASTTGGKAVTYTFCLGYSNCVPHRYEANVHANGVDTKILKESEHGWVDSKIDPVMAADLGAMARNEPGGNMVRPLSPDEKERIADHQGKIHVELVDAARGGTANKDHVKKILQDLEITNIDQLTAYDSRLAKNDVAVEAVNELSDKH